MKNILKRIPLYLIAAVLLFTSGAVSLNASAADSAASQLVYGGGDCGRYIVMKANYPCEGELVIPDYINGIPVTEIYSMALQNTKITSLYMPDTVVNLYSGYNFDGCRELKEVRLSDNLEVITMNAFSNCDSLETVYIGKGVTHIYARAFSCSESLEYVELPLSIKEIRSDAFTPGGLKCTFYPGNASDWEKVDVSDRNVHSTILYKTYISDVNAEGDGIAVTADERPGAEIYTFYRQEKIGGSWSASEEVASTSAESFTDMNVIDGHIYRYAVKASNGPYTTAVSDFSDEITEITPIKEIDFSEECSVSLSESAYTYNGEAITPAVSVTDSNGNRLVEGADYTVQYENGRVNPGKYTVTVTGKGLYKGEKVLSFTIAPEATRKITASQSTSSITLKWSKVTGADGYRVYVYNTKTKKYEKLKNVKGTTLKIKDLKSGTIYKYRVRAYTKDDGTIYGSYSAVLETSTKPATPSLKVTSTKKGVASFSWSNVAGESGYQIYYSTKKDGDYKKLASYKANTVKASKTGLKSKKTYYFKVRAYKKTDSGTVYSSWSSVKKIVIK